MGRLMLREERTSFKDRVARPVTPCRLRLGPPAGGPEEFLGVQIQLSISRVQSRSYPYLYCVLLARQGFGLRERLRRTSRVGNEVVEYSAEQDVQAVVYWQYTTRQKGYHANYRARMHIITGALRLACQALAVA